MREYSYFTYLMSNKTNSVIYIGVTNDLERRIYEHKYKVLKGFTGRYNVNKLVYFEETDDVNQAIRREKQIKGWIRIKKVKLIESKNLNWDDLSKDWYE